MMGTAIKNLGITGGFAALVWAGYVADIEGARNVAAFVLWLVFLPVSVLGAAVVAVASTRCREKMVATAKPVKAGPVVRWTNTVFALACVGVMAWSGAFVVAAGLLISWACSAYTTKAARALYEKRMANERSEVA